MDRILLDVVKKTGLKPAVIFAVALEWSCNHEENEVFDPQTAMWSWEKYSQGGTKLPLYVEDFCLSLMVGEIIVLDKGKGKMSFMERSPHP